MFRLILDKSTKICCHIQSAVSPLHITNEEVISNHINGYSPALAPPPAAPLSTLTAVQGTRMSNSFPNVNITNPIKGLVSKRRNRYKKDGFNLDLTCILYLSANDIALNAFLNETAFISKLIDLIL